MSLHRHHHDTQPDDQRSSRNLRTALLLNVSFTVIELIGGLLTNSVAILSDAVHDLGDSVSLGLAWYFERKSHRGRTPSNTYGYRRYALLGGLITGAVLLIGLSFVLWHAVGRLFAPEPVNAPGMLVLALIGVAFNGVAVLRMRSGTSMTERIVSWHLLEDALGWVAVLVGAAIMSVWDVPIIDPLLSIGISLFVLWNVYRNLRSVFHVLLQRVPEGFDVEQFEADVLAQPCVTEIHHTHSWSIDGERHVLTMHVVVSEDADRTAVVAIKEHIRDALDPKVFEHVAVDVEYEDEVCVACGESAPTGTSAHG